MFEKFIVSLQYKTMLLQASGQSRHTLTVENVGSNPTWSTTKCWVNLLMARRGVFQASDDGSIPSPSTKCGCGVMVATLGSEPGIRDGVWVRLPSSAQMKIFEIMELSYRWLLYNGLKIHRQWFNSTRLHQIFGSALV